MSNFCPGCGKMRSIEPDDSIEINGLEISDEGTISGTAHLILNCAECSSEMKSADVEFEVSAPKDLEDHLALDGDHELEIEFEPEAVDRYDGKTETPSRYRRHYYGFSGDATVKCSCDTGFEGTVPIEGFEQASSFEPSY